MSPRLALKFRGIASVNDAHLQLDLERLTEEEQAAAWSRATPFLESIAERLRNQLNQAPDASTDADATAPASTRFVSFTPLPVVDIPSIYTDSRSQPWFLSDLTDSNTFIRCFIPHKTARDPPLPSVVFAIPHDSKLLFSKGGLSQAWDTMFTCAFTVGVNLEGAGGIPRLFVESFPPLVDYFNFLQCLIPGLAVLHCTSATSTEIKALTGILPDPAWIQANDEILRVVLGDEASEEAAGRYTTILELASSKATLTEVREVNNGRQAKLEAWQAQKVRRKDTPVQSAPPSPPLPTEEDESEAVADVATDTKKIDVVEVPQTVPKTLKRKKGGKELYPEAFTSGTVDDYCSKDCGWCGGCYVADDEDLADLKLTSKV